MTDNKYRPIICPQCGTPIASPTAGCIICQPLPPATANGYRLCLMCGHLRHLTAATCPHCGDTGDVNRPTKTWWGTPPDYSTVPTDFLHLFAGFCLGEASIGIVKNTSGPYPGVDVRTSVGLRDDDAPVLRLAHQFFPGSALYAKRFVQSHHAGWHSQLFWNLNGVARNLAFLPLIELYGASLPCKKLGDVRLVLQYLRWRISRPLRLSADDWVMIDDYIARLQTQRQYQEPTAVATTRDDASA
jgi:hypothetical protein